MALKFIEGFGAYGTGAHSSSTAADDLLLQWNSYTSVTITALENGNNGWRRYATGILGAGAQPNLGGASFTTLVIGMRFWHTNQNAANLIARLYDSGVSLLGSFGLIGLNLVYSRSTSSNLATAADRVLIGTKPLKPNQWNYIECKVLFSNTVGTVDFRVNGEAAGSVTGADTLAGATTGPMTILDLMANSTSDWQTGNRIADLYLDDATIHGPMEIWYQEADAAGTESAWTPLASTNQSQVDEIGSDEDTTYNSSTAAGDTDSLGTTNTLDAAPLAIQPMVHARVVNPGSATLKVGTKSDPGGTPTESFGSTDGLGDTYDGVVGAIDELDPDTAAAWTAANADAAEIMYEHVA